MNKTCAVLMTAAWLGMCGMAQATSTNYFETVSSNAPVAYWRFNETSGTNAVNSGSLGSAANGVYGSNVELGRAGLLVSSADPALGLPAKDIQSRMLLTSFAMPQAAVSITFLVNGQDNGLSHFFGYGVAGSYNEFTFGSSAGDFLCFIQNNSYTFQGVDVLDGVTHHVGITWEAATGLMCLYVDGSQVGSNTVATGSLLDSGGVFAVAQELDSITPPSYGMDPAQAFVGTLDELAVFDKVLTLQEIASQAAAAEFAPPLSNPTFVTIGNVGNTNDTTGYGGVAYEYKISDHEVTIAEFQASGASIGTPNENYWNDGIHTVGTNAPAVNVSLYEAMKYCNYLTSGNVSNGYYSSSDGGTTYVANSLSHDAYAATNGITYFVPTEDEWYKAAYYDASGAGGYSIYANGTNTVPTEGGVETGWNYNYVNAAPNNTRDVALGTPEQNATVNMMGNVWEWLEDDAGAVRGGSYGSDESRLRSSHRDVGDSPSAERSLNGFRPVKVEPAPATSTIYFETVASNAPVAYWRFSETSGTNAFNSGSLGAAANGVYGSNVELGRAGLLASSIDPALGLPAKDIQSRMLLTSFAMPQAAVSVTFLVNGQDDDWSHFLGYGVAGSDNEFTFGSSAGLFRSVIQNSVYDFQGVDVLDGVTHHVGITWESATGLMCLYVDGSQVGSHTVATGSLLDSGGVFAVAQDLDSITPPSFGMDSDQSFVGTLDELAVFETVLTPQEIASQAAAAKASPPLSNPTFVTIGNAGNADDTSSYGGVAYEYKISATEVTIAQFAASGAGDGDENYWNDGTRTVGTNAPAVNVSLYEAMKYCNYLTSGNVSNGYYSSSDGGATYQTNAMSHEAYADANGLTYFVPTEDEWYKAAYYNGSGYSIYANGTNTVPTEGGVETGWNYNYVNAAPNNTRDVALGTPEQNATVNMMGNVWEWLEDDAGAVRGGSYGSDESRLRSSHRDVGDSPSAERSLIGFRPVKVGTEPTEPVEITFQQGVGGYTDIVDIYISTDFTGTDSAGSFMGVFLDTADSREDQALIRFNNIFGNGAGQIPLTASITSATLTLTLTGQQYDTSIGTSAVHRLSKDWTTSHDWTSSFWGGDGIQNDGAEAAIEADDTGTWLVSGGTTDFDVLSSLQAWQAGAGNYGWYLHDQSDSGDRPYIATSDFGTTASRPLLTVEFTVPVPASLVLLGLDVSWPSRIGHSYSVLTTTNLVTVPWSPVVPGWTNGGTGGIMIYTNAYPEYPRFFRVNTWIP